VAVYRRPVAAKKVSSWADSLLWASYDGDRWAEKFWQFFAVARRKVWRGLLFSGLDVADQRLSWRPHPLRAMSIHQSVSISARLGAVSSCGFFAGEVRLATGFLFFAWPESPCAGVVALPARTTPASLKSVRSAGVPARSLCANRIAAVGNGAPPPKRADSPRLRKSSAPSSHAHRGVLHAGLCRGQILWPSPSNLDADVPRRKIGLSSRLPAWLGPSSFNSPAQLLPRRRRPGRRSFPQISPAAASPSRPQG